MKRKVGFAVVSLVAIILLGLVSCQKNASIVGTWSFNSEHDHVYVNGTSTLDTTTSVSGVQVVLNSDGTFGGNFWGTGTYSYQGSTLTINDGTYISYYHVARLDDHNLQLSFTDTVSTGPLKTIDITYGFAR